MLDFLTDRVRSVYAKTRNDWRKKPVLDILACCPVGDDVVWRISIDHKVSLDPWHQDDIPDIRKEEDSASTEVAVLDAARMDEVELICYDKTGGLLPITPIQFEDQLIQYDDAIKRHQVYSIRLSAKTEALSFEARVNGAKGTLTIGFDRWRHYVQDALHLRRDAWYQPDYDRWLRAHPDYADVDCTNVYSLPETHVMVMGDDVLLAPCAFERMAQTLTEYPDAWLWRISVKLFVSYGRHALKNIIARLWIAH